MKRILIASLAAALLTFGVAACGDDEEEASTESTEETGDEDTAEADEGGDETAEADEADEGGDDEGGGDVCERARTCCTAYIAAMPSTAGMTAETACAGVAQLQGPAAAPGCQAAIDGWRQGLEALNADVPASCQ